MSNSLDREQAVALLKVALAGIGEELADLGARAIAKNQTQRARLLAKLIGLADDGRTIAQAIVVLERRPRLLP